MPETLKMHPIGALFSSSWRTYKERFRVLIKIALIPALFFALGSLAISQGFPAAILGGVFNLTGVVLAIFASIAMLIALEHKTDFNESYRRSTVLFWPYLWVSILSGLAVIGGFVMLVIPGIILAIALGFSKYIIVLENRRGMDVVIQSRAYTKGYWWSILGRYILLGLCLGAIMLVVYLPLMLILGKLIGGIIYAILAFLFTPFSLIYLYEIYKNLVALKPEVHAHQATSGKTFLTVSAVIGVVAPIVFLILFIVFLGMFIKPYMQRNPAFLQQMQYQYEYGMPTSTANSTSSALGMHCGGFIQNAPTCPEGYRCQLNLRTPDTGGMCVPD